MKNNIQVTIGLCVKNVEKTISATVDGILCQNFPHESIELIVVDGCSSDRTVNVIKEKVIKSDISTRFFEENSGLGQARQIVVDNALGKYIQWVDGDNILPCVYVREQFDFMEKNPDAGIAEGQYALCPGNSLVSTLENLVAVLSFRSDDVSQLGHLAATGGSMWRVEAIQGVGGFDSSIKGAAEDSELSYRVKKAGWSLLLNEAKFQAVCRETWKALWKQYYWYGYGAYYIYHKDYRTVNLYTMVPPAGFLAGLLYLSSAYGLGSKKSVFLLPIHYAFKRTAWCLGFIKAQLIGYGH